LESAATNKQQVFVLKNQCKMPAKVIGWLRVAQTIKVDEFGKVYFGFMFRFADNKNLKV
jgi:hypothetical protein